MNIEEERKAFKQYTALDSKVYNDELAIWLKAKQHATDMAKPTVKIKPKGIYSEMSAYQWVVSLFEGETFNGVLEDFITKEDAEAWARSCGYRVIE